MQELTTPRAEYETEPELLPILVHPFHVFWQPLKTRDFLVSLLKEKNSDRKKPITPLVLDLLDKTTDDLYPLAHYLKSLEHFFKSTQLRTIFLVTAEPYKVDDELLDIALIKKLGFKGEILYYQSSELDPRPLYSDWEKELQKIQALKAKKLVVMGQYLYSDTTLIPRNAADANQYFDIYQLDAAGALNNPAVGCVGEFLRNLLLFSKNQECSITLSPITYPYISSPTMQRISMKNGALIIGAINSTPYNHSSPVPQQNERADTPLGYRKRYSLF